MHKPPETWRILQSDREFNRRVREMDAEGDKRLTTLSNLPAYCWMRALLLTTPITFRDTGALTRLSVLKFGVGGASLLSNLYGGS